MITVKTLVDTAKLVAYGLGIAILMGVFFGLTIGLGGGLLGIETAKLLTYGAMSGWASSFVAMVCVVLRLKRQRSAQQTRRLISVTRNKVTPTHEASFADVAFDLEYWQKMGLMQ